MFLAVFSSKIMLFHNFIIGNEKLHLIPNIKNGYLIWQFHIFYGDLPQSYYQFFIQMISKHFQV